ncbi:MAG: hypothetical protein ACTS22_08165 [Phycisphaerales bacterium]
MPDRRRMLICFVPIAALMLGAVNALAQAPNGWIEALDADPVRWRHDDEQNITRGVGIVPVRTEHGEDWFFLVRREYRHELRYDWEQHAGQRQMMLFRWVDGTPAEPIRGRMSFKVTVSGKSREFHVELMSAKPPAWVLEAIGAQPAVLDANGNAWEYQSAKLVSEIEPEAVRDMVRGIARGAFGDTLFKFVDKGPFREVEDDLVRDDGFAVAAQRAARDHRRERLREGRGREAALRRPFRDPADRPSRDQPEPATSAPPPSPRPDAPPAAPAPPPTHELELLDGRVFLGRLDSAPDADPVVFVIVVGSVEQPMRFPSDEVRRIITYRTAGDGPTPPEDDG